jgi:hypothetical protein
MAITKVLNVEIKDNALDVSKDIDKLNKSGENLEQTFKDVNATFEDVYGELQPLTTRLGEAEDRLYELALAGKQNTQEYKELLQATANYRQVQLQTDLVVDSAAQTMAQKLGGALDGAASGFALVQGAMGLFGTESEEVEKALLRVQSAMALAQGIDGIRTALPLFKSFGGVIKNAVVGAFTTLRGAIISTGIGALAVALGAAANAMGLFGGETEDAAEAQEKLAESIVKTTSEIERRIGRSLKQLELQRKEAEAFGATELELFEMRRKAITQEENFRITQYEENKRRLKDLENKKGDAVKSEIENLKKQNSALFDSLYNRIQGENDYDLQRRELELEYQAFKNEQLLEEEKKADEKKQKRIEKAEETRKALEEQERQRILNIQQLEQDFLAELEEAESGYFDSLLSEQEQEVRVVEDKYFNLLTKAQEYNANLTEEEQAKRINTVTLEEARLKEIADIQEKYRKEAADKEKEAAKEVADAKKDIQDSQIANVEAGISLLSKLAGDSRELQALSIAAENAVGIAKIIINTQAANAAAKLKYAAIPGGLALAAAEITANKVSAGIGIAASAAAAAKGIASLKQSVPVDTGGNLGGGGGLSNATQQLASPNFNVVGASGVSQAESLGPVKAYVVSGDVTTAQALDRNRINNATF